MGEGDLLYLLRFYKQASVPMNTILGKEYLFKYVP